MNYKSFLDEIASDFLSAMSKVSGVVEIPTEDYGGYVNEIAFGFQEKVQWNNYRYKSDCYRFAHLERYGDDKLQVLHITTFPNLGYLLPIFGFDVITINSRPIGCYFDLSPTSKESHYISHLNVRKKYENIKPLPDWSEDIFSEDYCFIEPNGDEDLRKFCAMCFGEYENYLKFLQRNEHATYSAPAYNTTIEKQNKYCEVQSGNPRTYSVLKQKLGEERARYFMQEVLFPKVKMQIN